MKILVPLLLTISLASAVWSAPAKPAATLAAPQVDIAPEARAIFARAVGLYGKTEGLSVTWSSTEYGGTKRASLDFDRAGKLRLANNYPLEALIVIDGKTKWVLDDSKIIERNAVRYLRQSVDAQDIETDPIFVLKSSLGLASPIGNFLGRINPLDSKYIAMDREINPSLQVRTALLPAQPLNGNPCDLLRVTATYNDLDDPRHFQVVEQKTYWFARQDGRLTRLQERQFEAGREARVADFQIITQDFNPTFAPDTFKFTPPVGAKLQTN